MPTFPLWDRATRDVSKTETITVDRSEVGSTNDVEVRTCNETMRACTNLVKKDGTSHLVGVPAGEVHDRLNDDYSEAPTPGMFAGMATATPSVITDEPDVERSRENDDQDDEEDDTDD